MRCIYFLFTFVCTNLYAQELPPIVTYPPTAYQAGNQNWMISQANNKHIYVGNNAGILEFNGSVWKLYPSPNKEEIIFKLH